MEQDQPYVPPTPPTPNLLYIDDQSRHYLTNGAMWAKFLAIIGFIYCFLMVILAFFIGTFFSMFSANMMDSDLPGPGMGIFTGGFMTVLLLVIAIVYFFPCLYLYRFADKMQQALRNSSQAHLTTSFQNLRANLRFMGILVIVGISCYLLALILSVIFASAM